MTSSLLARVAIVVPIRERYSTYPRMIRRLVRSTPPVGSLLLLDPEVPASVKRRVQRALGDRPCRWVPVPFGATDHAQRNAAAAMLDDDVAFVAVVENDVSVRLGWLDGLVTALVEEDADVVRPALRDRRGVRPWSRPHFSTRMGHAVQAPDGTWSIEPAAPTGGDAGWGGGRRPTTVLENHLIVYRRAALDRLLPLDPRVGAGSMYDLSLRCAEAGLRVVFEPAVQVTFHDVPPVRRIDRRLYERTWSIEQAELTHAALAERWGSDLGKGLRYNEERLRLASVPGYLRVAIARRLGLG